MDEQTEKINQILEGLQILNKGVEELQNQFISQQKIANGSENTVDEFSTKFLLEEYKEISDAWKHLDSRFGSTLSLYLTISGALIPLLVILSKDFKNVNLFLIALIFSASILAVSGTFVTTRFALTSITKHEYFYAMNLIRRFFADHDPKIAPYLFLPFDNKSLELKDTERSSIRRPNTSRFIIVTHIWVGILVGFVVSTTLWLVFSSANLLILTAIGVAVAVICSYWLEVIIQQSIKNRVSRLWDRKQSLLSSLLK